MPANAKFNICEECFSNRRFNRRPHSVQGQQAQGGGKKRNDRSRRPEKPAERNASNPSSGAQKKKTAPSSTGVKPSGRSGGIKKPSGAVKKNAADAFRKHR